VSVIVHRRDLDFLLHELLDLDRLFATARYDGLDRPMVTGLLDTAQAIAEQHYLPLAASLDANEPRFVDGRAEIMPEVGEALRAYADAGLIAAGFDTDAGGLQLPYTVTVAMNGMFNAANIGIANYAMLTTANANMLNAFGTDAQKQVFLPPMLEGRWLGTMCLSEPQAGSSLSDIRTQAHPIGDNRYRISGTKMWISGGDHDLSENIVHMVLAKIPGGPAGVKGISLFLVPKYRVGADGKPGESNNIALAGLNHKMGHRGTTNCLLNFGEDGDCIGELIGEPHNGLRYMFHMMNEARISVGHGAVMSALSGYLHAFDYACGRTQGRLPRDKDPETPQVPIIEHADVRRMLMAQKAAVEGGLSLIFHCAMLVDLKKVTEDEEERSRIGLLLELLTPIAKSWPSEHCLEANKLAIQVFGGYGYTRDYPVERLYRDNRLNHIHEGTYAIHGIDLLGRKVRMQDGEALRLLVSDILQTIDGVRADDGLDAESRHLRAAVDQLQSTTAQVLACADLSRGLANATLYLDAFGHVVIAWMWLRQALEAQKRLRPLPGENAFYAGKIAACRYFFRYELPKAVRQLELVASLDETCLDLSPDQLLAR